MPSYDYLCDTCGSIEERFSSIKDCVSTVDCVCGGIKNKIILECPGFRTNFAVGVTKTPLEYYGREALAKPSTFLDE